MGDDIYSHCGRGGTDGDRWEMTYTHTVAVEVQTGVDGECQVAPGSTASALLLQVKGSPLIAHMIGIALSLAVGLKQCQMQWFNNGRTFLL